VGGGEIHSENPNVLKGYNMAPTTKQLFRKEVVPNGMPYGGFNPNGSMKSEN
jgi:hypothetical protein